MIRQLALQLRFALPIFFCLVLSTISLAQGLDYPQTRKDNQVDDYHGTKVADPYRWLEDDNSAETAKWVEAENKVTFGYLDKIPYRGQLKARLEQLFNYPKYTAPFRRGDYLFFTKNDGAWMKNAAEEARLIDALRKGRDFTVKSTSLRGNATNDRYSLSGIGQALDRVDQECK